MANNVNFGINNVSSSKLPPSTGVSQDIVFKGNMCNIAKAEDIVSIGSVLSQSTATDRQLVLSPYQSLTVVGVSMVNTLEAGSEVCIAVGGEFQVLVTGAVVRGDLLWVSNTLGVAESDGGGSSNYHFAVASNSNPDTGIKLVWARFIKSETY